MRLINNEGIVQLVSQFLKQAYVGLFRQDVWNIGVVNQPIWTFLTSGARPAIHWLPPVQHGKFLADPFGAMRDSTLHIICEEFDYNTYSGKLVTMSFDTVTSAFTEPRTAMTFSHHAAYPFLIQDREETYCVPETYEAREVSLYRVTDFPDKWEKVAVLVPSFRGLDSTLFQYEGHWWITASNEDDGPLEKLYVWHSKNLLGPWVPHAANPVKNDIRSSRPAGTPFMYNGSLYRPAQDNSRTYGGRIVISRVTKLTPYEFEEEPAATIEPYRNSPWPDGVHTLCSVGDHTLIDGKRTTFVWSGFKQALARRKLLRRYHLQTISTSA